MVVIPPLESERFEVNTLLGAVLGFVRGVAGFGPRLGTMTGCAADQSGRQIIEPIPS
jgi:hypothetical protein